MGEMRWQPIETAPKDGTKVDLFAKCWLPDSDTFTLQRFTDCYWTTGDSMTNRSAHWRNLDMGWYPIAWMPLPAPPTEPE